MAPRKSAAPKIRNIPPMKLVSVEIVSAPASLPVTPEEFWTHARLVNSAVIGSSDSQVERELTAATNRAELFTRRSLITQTLLALYVPEASGNGSALILPRGKVQSIVEVKGPDGVIASGGGYTQTGNLVLLTSTVYGPVTVQWRSGFGDSAADVPEVIREGIYEYATVLFEGRKGERENKYASQGDQSLPSGVRDLWRNYQIELGG